MGVYPRHVFRFSEEDEVAVGDSDAYRIHAALDDIAKASDALAEDRSREIVLTSADEVCALIAAIDLISSGDAISGDLRALRHRLGGRARQLGRDRSDPI